MGVEQVLVCTRSPSEEEWMSLGGDPKKCLFELEIGKLYKNFNIIDGEVYIGDLRYPRSIFKTQFEYELEEILK